MLTRRRLLLLSGGAATAPIGISASARSPSAGGAYLADALDLRRLGGTGDGRADDGKALSAAIRQVLSGRQSDGSPRSISIPPGRYRLSRSMAVDAEAELVFQPGAELAPDAGTILTVHGPIHAGPQRIFAGEGEVRLAQPGPVSVLWFGAEDGKEATAAFGRAIAAILWGTSATWRQGRGVIDVPPTRTGFFVKGLRIPSGVRLRGAGANSSRLVNDGRDNRPLLEVIGLKGAVVRDVRIEGLYLEGNPSSGDGIRFEDHGYNEVADCFIRGHGGDGIVARKRESTMSDGLSLTDVYLTQNRGAGLRIERNSHGCAANNCILVNNAGGNAVISGTYFNMWGGMVNGVEGTDGVRMEGVNCGGFWGVGFEATPAVKKATTLLRLVSVRSLVVAGSNFVPSGNDGDCVCIAADSAQDCTLISPFFDANCTGDVIAMSVGSRSENLQVLNPRFGSNHGSGGFVALEDMSRTTALTTGNARPSLPAFIAVTGKDTTLSSGGKPAAVRFDALTYGPPATSFDTATGAFKAPVTGLYRFDVQLRLTGTQNAYLSAALRAGAEAVPLLFSKGIAGPDKDDAVATLSAVVRLMREETATIEVLLPHADSAPLLMREGSRFSGYLVA